jgi:hypothetical protein
MVDMKTSYCLIVLAGAIFWAIPARGQESKPQKVDVLALKAIPDGKYSVKLELKQLDGEAAAVELEARSGRITSADDTGRLGKIQGRTQFLGNGVFMVQLEGKGYLATQFWVFQADGSAAIKEIPDRGEKQFAVPVAQKAPK